MLAIVWENLLAPALAAAIAGGLLILGNWLQNRETRRRSTNQHVEQTVLLETLASDLSKIATDVVRNREVASAGHAKVSGELSELKGQLNGVAATSNILFGMIAEVDAKVSKPSRKKVSTSVGAGVPSE